MIDTWRVKFLLLFTSLVQTIPQIAVAAEETSRETWETLFINWFPMLLLIAVWIYFMRKHGGKWQSWGGEEMNRHLEKIEQSLERIARALEKK